MAWDRYTFLRNMTLGYALDLGCGNGITLHGYHKRWMGVDNFRDLDVQIKEFDQVREQWGFWPENSLEDIRKRKREEIRDFYRKNNIPFLEADGRALPLMEGTFDTVLISEVLEHVSSPLDLLYEAVRVTKPLGRIVLTVPLEHEWHKSRRPMEDETHLLHFKVPDVRYLLEETCRKTGARIHLFYHTKQMENEGFSYIYSMLIKWPRKESS